MQPVPGDPHAPRRRTVDVEVALSGGGRKKMQVRLGSYPSGG
jgi:hypothetical protein